MKFGADVGDALAAIGELKQAVAAIAEPAGRIKTAFAEADAAFRQAARSAVEQRRADAASLAVFKANMQAMADARAVSLRQAIGFDIEYTAQLAEQQRARLEASLGNEAAGTAAHLKAFQQLVELDQRYAVQFANDQKKMADA